MIECRSTPSEYQLVPYFAFRNSGYAFPEPILRGLSEESSSLCTKLLMKSQLGLCGMYNFNEGNYNLPCKKSTLVRWVMNYDKLIFEFFRSMLKKFLRNNNSVLNFSFRNNFYSPRAHKNLIFVYTRSK